MAKTIFYKYPSFTPVIFNPSGMIWWIVKSCRPLSDGSQDTVRLLQVLPCLYSKIGNIVMIFICPGGFGEVALHEFQTNGFS